MAPLKSRLVLGSLVTLGILGMGAPAWAQAAAENVAAARALGTEGIRLADSGNCAAAVEKLERAEALYHAPTTLARLGECQVALGKIVLGTENLNRVVRETLPPNPPQAFIDAQTRARQVLETALPRIGQLTVSVEPAGIQPSVTVDGVALPNALLGAPRPTDPGTHEVRASAPGHLAVAQAVALAEGGTAQIVLTLHPDPNAAATQPGAVPVDPGAPQTGAPAPVAPAPANATFDSGASSAPNHTAAYVLLGVGGAGLVAGSVFGLLAISKKGDLDCPSQQCPPGEQTDNLDSARTLATVSTIGFGVGLAGAAVGTILLVAGGGDEKAARRSRRDVAARPWIGLGSAGVAGTF